MIQVFNKKEDCCGCSACQSICPKSAISFKQDNCGFFYPDVDNSKCIECGLCKQVCSFSDPLSERKLHNTKSYVVKHRIEEVVKDSRSGGVFTAVSDDILNNGGVVYGVLLDKDLVVRHARATTKEERDEFRKSKYVQSILEDVFGDVIKDLKNGKTVLFSGTPCQCDGVKHYVEKMKISADNLILCDLVCHSSASPGLFYNYLRYQERKYKQKIIDFYFRDKKKYNWMEHVEKIEFENGKVTYTDEYTNMFFSDNIRPSCFKCKYTSLNRVSDLTMADCWGGQNVYPDIVDNKTGASLVLVNTEKGNRLLLESVNDIILKNIDIEKVMQPRFKECEKKSNTYEQFWSDYNSLPFDIFMKKYGHNNYSIGSVTVRKLKSLFKLPAMIVEIVWRKYIMRKGR